MLVLLAAVALADPAPPPVVGGTEVTGNTWPDTAAVYFGNQVGCTGTLVAPNLVLTAGHCVGGITKVKVGTDDYTSGGEEIRVRQTIEYPDSQRTYDAAVLVLERDATTPPRTLALDCVLDDHLRDGAEVQIVGYGATNSAGTRYPTSLYEATTTVTDADCSDYATGCERSVSPNGEVAAGGDGVDSCYGDSGGPLYLLADGAYYLVGITSRGVNGSSLCGYGGIYVRPDAIADWIESETGVTLARPTCNLPPAPSADPIEVVEGNTAYSQVLPNDPDAADTHTFTLTADPAFGAASVDGDGRVTYVADGGPGTTTLIVTVEDDAGGSAAVTIDVAVAERAGGEDDTGGGGGGDDTELPGGDDRDADPSGGVKMGACACGTTSAPGAGWLLLVGAALVARRRR